MMKLRLPQSLTALALLGMGLPAAHGQSVVEQLGNAVSEGTVNFSMRFRHETVDQDNALADAAASTVLTRMTLQSAPVSGFSGVFEVDNVSTFASDSYDSFVLDEYRGTHSIIADPVGTEVNQAYLQYQASEGFKARLGMQRIVHAAQRFIGGVAWRQNEQTFDAFTASYADDAFSLDYSYVWNVNRIFNTSKPSAQLGDLDSDSHFLLASTKGEWGTLSGFVYALDFSAAGALSSMTAGLSYTGTLGPASILASFATQNDFANNPVDYSANYINLEAGLPVGPARVIAGVEILGSDSGIKSFTTPLATLHKWQGWTDLFLGTPASGIEDRYLTVSGNIGKVGVAATYHDFQAEFGSADYGGEWDLIANFAINEMVSTQLKYATYDSDGYAVDTDKFWFMVNVVF
jgi:hypothetical protein